MRNPIAVILLSFGVLLVNAPSEAARFDCPSGDVNCLIAAINQSNANGEENTIVLAAGVYTLTAIDNDTDGPNGLPSIAGRLTIQGAGASSTTIRRNATEPWYPGCPSCFPDLFFRILHVGPGGALTARRITVSGGELGGNASRGAGILALGSVTVIDSTVSDNGHRSSLSVFGGGISSGGAVVITRSAITNNSGHRGGGGVFIEGSGTLTVTGSVISDNDSLSGGGVRFISSGDLTISDSRVVHNFALSTGSGGGLLIGAVPGRASIATITRTTIANNFAGGGGGINYGGDDGHLTIAQSAIVGNTAITAAGVWVSGSMTLTASTVANNVSTIGTGGVSLSGTGLVTNATIVGNSTGATSGTGAGVFGDIHLQNSIVAGNTGKSAGVVRPADCGGSIMSLGNNLFGDPTGCGSLLATDLTGDPGVGTFVDPGRAGAAHFPLLPGSRAIDMGDNAACGATDQEGLARPVDGNGDGVRVCDIGAIEFYPVVNDLVRLDSLRSVYSPPTRHEQTNPLTAGGTFAISAMFTDVTAHDICNVAFQVIELRGQAGDTPAVVTRHEHMVGTEGIIVRAMLAGANDHLRAHHRERYDFTVGLSQKEPITFLVNVLGDATSGSCGRDDFTHDGGGHRIGR